MYKYGFVLHGPLIAYFQIVIYNLKTCVYMIYQETYRRRDLRTCVMIYQETYL